MKRLAILLVGLLSLAAFPVNKGLVTDNAAILTPGEKTALEQKLRAFEQKTTVEIAVVTVTSLDGMTIDEYRVKLFEAWKIGKKGKDNGVLLVFAPNEPPTGKVGIEVGYGLEPLLNDAATGTIARERIRPGWRSDHRANGVIAGVDAIIERLSQAPPEAATTVTAPAVAGQSQSDLGLFLIWVGALFAVAAVVAYVLIRRSNRKYEEMQAETRRRAREDWATLAATDPVVRGSYGPPTHRRAVPVTPTRRHAVEPEPERRTTSFDTYAAPYEPPARHESYSSPDTSSSSSSSDSSYDFGGGSSGGGGSSNDL